MPKRYADYIHFSRWVVRSDSSQPVVVLVTWWEPEMGSEVFFYPNAKAAIKALNSPEWNQQFMTELDDEWEIHDDVVIRVMAF
jgi:S-formylglutathione hydrolase FrmB